MRSRYEGPDIPPGWDRSDPAGDLIEVSTGAHIRDVHHAGGWVRNPDGTAIRDSELVAMHNSMHHRDDSGATGLLLLFN
jgi:hypothetical protein